MKTALAAILLLSLAFATTSTVLAKAKPASTSSSSQASSGMQYSIVEASALSVTVSEGHKGDPNKTFKITDATKVTIDGDTANARDLRGGMFANISLSEDQTTATSIDAKDSKKPKKS